jgi:hypothetical protein
MRRFASNGSGRHDSITAGSNNTAYFVMKCAIFGAILAATKPFVLAMQ